MPTMTRIVPWLIIPPVLVAAEYLCAVAEQPLHPSQGVEAPSSLAGSWSLPRSVVVRILLGTTVVRPPAIEAGKATSTALLKAIDTVDDTRRRRRHGRRGTRKDKGHRECACGSEKVATVNHSRSRLRSSKYSTILSQIMMDAIQPQAEIPVTPMATNRARMPPSRIRSRPSAQGNNGPTMKMP